MDHQRLVTEEEVRGSAMAEVEAFHLASGEEEILCHPVVVDMGEEEAVGEGGEIQSTLPAEIARDSMSETSSHFPPFASFEVAAHRRIHWHLE